MNEKKELIQMFRKKSKELYEIGRIVERKRKELNHLSDKGFSMSSEEVVTCSEGFERYNVQYMILELEILQLRSRLMAS